jgi:glutamyl-tRNA reductase
MQLALVGLSHKTAPVEIRERLAFASDDLGNALRSLAGWDGVGGAMIVSTCNRVEVLAEVSDDRLVRDFLCSYHRVPPESIEHFLYSYRGYDVVRHLFRVASSLDSMVLGEPQILGQIKEAFRTAEGAGTIGREIGSVMTRAFVVAKKVRNETAIGESAVSVSFVAVELARKIFGSLEGRNVMIIGASKMGELAARHLKSNGVSSVQVTSRTFENAVEMAKTFEGVAIPFERFGDHIDRADIVISSTGSPHYVVTKSDAERIIRLRKNRPMFFIDIAVPRDIDPSVNELDSVFLYDIDDLQQVVDGNVEERRSEANRAEGIVNFEVEAFCARMQSREVVPVIVEIQRAAEEFRTEQVARYGKSLDESQKDTVDRITKSMIRKLLAKPIAELKDSVGQSDGAKRIDLIRRMFDLNGK